MSELLHYGTPRHSGRYPWGSGENPYQHERNFMSTISTMKKEGMSEAEIAKSFGMSSTELRRLKSIAKDEVILAEQQEIMRLHDKGYSNMAIGRRMGMGESTVRNRLNKALQERRSATRVTADELKKELLRNKYIDVGPGTEIELGVTRTKLDTALAMLKKEGYPVHTIYVEQAGNPGKYTTLSVLGTPGTKRADVIKNRADIHTINERVIDVDGSTKLGVMNVKGVSSDRIKVNYKEDGGDKKDGVIELRRGVDDISLGDAQYAQVRIAVDGTHYLKGMAVYNDNMPDGVDIIFNTNKHVGTPKKDVFKKMKDDPDNPFGATILDADDLKLTQKYYIDKNGKKQLSALNIVNEEGKWNTWSRNLASQFLSKQSTSLAKKQLDLAYAEKKDEYETIASLTNPTLKRKLLETFADDCDSSAVHLKAAALPRQSTKVILPVSDMKDDQIYAPTYPTGTKVVLIRYPHGGIFEIPELTVNNRQKTAKSMMHNVTDAVGINSNVAARLSGADFDGDTVLVIPTTNAKGERTVSIRTKDPNSSQALKSLKDFDPKELYKLPDSAPPIKNATKQTEMGKVSNLITDMTLMGATDDEIVRAVKHSMVVIDSEKHHLNYKQSAIDNGIAELKEKYQGSKNAGAATLISKASAETHIPKRKAAYKPDAETGEKIFYETGETYEKKKRSPETGEVISSKTVLRTEKSTQMADTNDAYTLVSKQNTRMERIYANYANQMKALGNTARKEMMSTGRLKSSPSAKQTYSTEVSDLKAKLQIALKNAPRERKAQVLANAIFEDKRKDNPDMTNEEKKKIRSQALATARTRVGAKKELITITDKEWDAIQSGAISDTLLEKILNNTDLDALKKRATPRQVGRGLSDSKKARIKALSNSGYTISDIADMLGLSSTTISETLNS